MQKTFKTKLGLLTLSNPTKRDLPSLIELLKKEDLDLRGLVSTSNEGFFPRGTIKIHSDWDRILSDIRVSGAFPLEVARQIKIQSIGILSYQQIPKPQIEIKDPFNMTQVESEIGLSQMQITQLANILVMKKGDKIVCSARVLFVEGFWEIVSIVTVKEYRRNGLAQILINEIFSNYLQRPLYSFQTLDLIPYYLKAYSKEKVTIPPFTELPKPLQRDLFYMNIFWGPNVIIKIGDS